MTDLFGIDVKGLVGDVFGGQLQALTIHSRTDTISATGATSQSWEDEAGEGVLLQFDEHTRSQRGYTLETVKVLVIQSGIATPLTNGSEITISGKRYRIKDVMSSPGDAVWEAAGVPAW